MCRWNSCRSATASVSGRVRKCPLDGVRITVLETDAQAWRMGFCVLTDRGLVQVLYESDGDTSQWRYAEMSSEGWRGTGWPAGQN